MHKIYTKKPVFMRVAGVLQGRLTNGMQTQHRREGGVGRLLILFGFLFTFKKGIVATH